MVYIYRSAEDFGIPKLIKTPDFLHEVNPDGVYMGLCSLKDLKDEYRYYRSGLEAKQNNTISILDEADLKRSRKMQTYFNRKNKI
jgi:hypothetical protein